MKMKKESEKAGLKLNSQKTKIMASGPIPSWQMDGETMETVTGFIFLGSKITVDGDCSHEIKRHLLLWKKSYDQTRQHIKKQRHYFSTNICILKAMFVSVVMYRCQSRTINKAECHRIDAFKLWYWRRLLRVPWTARSNQSKGNQPWIFTERTDADAEALILWPPDAKSRLTGKDPDAEKEWRQEEKGETEDEMVGWHHWLNGHEFEQSQGDSEG